MRLERISAEQYVANLDEFGAVIDVRSPGEFAEDHIEGAVNLPVLGDEERERVGTIYKQVSSFEARRLGAALVSRNIANHLEAWLADKERDFRPLLYCWRGGQRSESLATVMAAAGWRPVLLDGGYRAMRRFIVSDFESHLEKAELRFVVIAGWTGSGKTWLLERLAARGHQVLDLEGLANHRGSVLGGNPDSPQPRQKRFENLLWHAVRQLDPGRTVFVESESHRVGNLGIPNALWKRLKAAEIVEVVVSREARATYLLDAYGHFVADPSKLRAELAKLGSHQPSARLAEWEAAVEAGAWREFVESILEHHYDPAYARSRKTLYGEAERRFELDAVDESRLDELAAGIAGDLEVSHTA